LARLLTESFSLLECALKFIDPIGAAPRFVGAAGRPVRKLNWQALRLASSKQVLAWADQTIVSATSFLALVLIGRWTGPAELGAYAIGCSVLAMLLATQDSLITRPYTIRLHKPLGTPAQHASSTLALSLLLAAAGMLVLAAAAMVLPAIGASTEIASIAWMLVAATPFVLLREFARRFAFAHLALNQALIIDVTVSGLNVFLLCWLGWTDKLNAVTAFGSVGVASGIGALGWLCLARREFALAVGQLGATLKQSWSLGKWLFAAQMALQTQGYLTYWLSLAIAGLTLTGAYAACVSIVSFANPIVFGFLNILTPRSVRTLKDSGSAGLRRQVAWDAALLTAMMGAFFLLIVLVGHAAMGFLYPGPNYAGYDDVLLVLAAASVVNAPGIAALTALASAEKAPAYASVTAVSALVSLVLIWSFMSHWGLLGAAWGVLIGEAFSTVLRWIVFLALVPSVAGPLPADGAAAN
jgi:O-antigen/teichoic acid export membrane protein